MTKQRHVWFATLLWSRYTGFEAMHLAAQKLVNHLTAKGIHTYYIRSGNDIKLLRHADADDFSGKNYWVFGTNFSSDTCSVEDTGLLYYGHEQIKPLRMLAMEKLK